LKKGIESDYRRYWKKICSSKGHIFFQLTLLYDSGDYGAFTVIADSLPVKTCMMLAVDAVRKKLTTIEGLNDDPMQRAIVEKWDFQCGYCTSGFILNAHALVNEHPDATEEVIEEWLSSNICRCTTYQEIKEAVLSVLNEQRGRTRNRR